jgi:hypothetical protein
MSERGPSSPTGSLQPSAAREASSVPASAPGGAVPAIADEEPRRQLGHRPCTAASMAAVAPTPTRPAAQPPRMDRNASDRQWMWHCGGSVLRGSWGNGAIGQAQPVCPAQNREGEPRPSRLRQQPSQVHVHMCCRCGSGRAESRGRCRGGRAPIAAATINRGGNTIPPAPRAMQVTPIPNESLQHCSHETNECSTTRGKTLGYHGARRRIER